MTAPKFPTLSGDRNFMKYRLTEVHRWRPITVEMESGHVETRRRGDKPLRRWQWFGNPLTTADMDLVMGFLYDRGGGSNFFYVDNPIPIWHPYDAPTTSSTTSGAIAGRTHYVTYAWSDGSEETIDSQEATQVVAGNDLLTVTPNKFPTGVTEARIYSGAVSGTVSFAGTVSTTGSTFTEPFSTVDANSASGQKVLNVAATTNFEPGQTVVVDEGSIGGGEENIVIDTVQAGVSITSTTNLANTHTAVQADEVYLKIGTGTSPQTTNGMTDIEYKVRMLNEPSPVLVATNIYKLTIDLEEMF